MWLVLVRVLVVVLLAHSGWVYAPFPERWIGLTLGILAALGLITLERKLRAVPGHHMVGALIGGVIGLFGARMVWGALDGLDIIGEHFVHALVVVFLGYMGIVIGGQKGEWFEPARIIAAFRDSSRLHQYKVLDTSVIIDGRIADICETGFLEGTLVVPQFVLRELQQVADSSDSLKRNRGRRGLDILQKMQKMTNVAVQIVETDFPEIREVDLKLIELARKLAGKIVTNDFNLNKVAQLRGVNVLNINELANSLKPVVLPGELMKVFIIKEGKEQGQGVGYLDDGTMVVVDQARKALGKTIEVSVTSVLQTTAGKMIFCRWPDAASVPDEPPRRDTRVGDRRDFVRNGRDPRVPERRENDRRDGERTGGLAPIPPSSLPGPIASPAMGAPAAGPASSTDGRGAEGRPVEPGSGAAPIAPGLVDRPAVKAE
ncbi:MAG: PIN domain nuclease [Acidobacteria bacterium]|nr:MAG: PIN domain nuclease [Acidobacteriota bacterium]